MKAVIHVPSHAAHQKVHAGLMAEGLGRHGVEVQFADWNVPRAGDVIVVWGWRQQAVIQAAMAARVPVLIMERGYLGDRFAWTSLAWNGLNGRGRFPLCLDNGERFARNFGHLLQPWHGGELVLVLGQVRGDQSLLGVDFEEWASAVCTHFLRRGARVVYRPHPNMGDGWHPAGAEVSSDSLSDDLSRARLAVTFNSNSGVDAVLAGVPTIACDEGSMAWPVTTHDFAASPRRPDRAAWASRLAWAQWTETEISDGIAWEAVRCGCVDD